MAGKTKLFSFEENLTGAYRGILQNELLPSARKLFGRSHWELVQDNDPKHASKVAMEFIKDREINIVKDWPSSSPT